ncbi:MAG: choice-of-anchor D domain-containing protein [Desulfomonile tiedjei]|nr:choice-of-anchor D domain-containing protein [Desulfomonile tiedjei]
MKNRKTCLIAALAAWSLAALLATPPAECFAEDGTLTGTFSGVYEGRTVPLIDASLEVFHPDNATLLRTIPLTFDKTGRFSIAFPSGECRIKIFTKIYEMGLTLLHEGFYDGLQSTYGVCFADGEPVTVTAGQTTDISSVLELRAPTKPPDTYTIKITGQIAGSTGDPGTVQVIALDYCTGYEWGKTEVSAGPFVFYISAATKAVRLRFVSANYPPEFYGAYGQDNFSLATPLFMDRPIDLGLVVLGQAPEIRVENALGFGDVALLDSRTQAVTVYNDGTRDLVVGSVAFETSHGDISFTEPPATPFTLAPGASRTISITYGPRAMGEAAALLAITSNDADESKVLVSLTGAGVASPAPPSEQVSQIAEVIVTGTTNGTLTPTGPGERATMLMNQIAAAGEMAAAGKDAAACAQLRNALQRVDGNPVPPDFLEGPDRELLRQLLQNTIDSLGCR